MDKNNGQREEEIELTECQTCHYCRKEECGLKAIIFTLKEAIRCPYYEKVIKL